MFYDYYCGKCHTIEELQSPIAERDDQYCSRCELHLVRLFQPSDVCIPGAFRVNLRSIVPTYQECAEIDKRNDEWLNRPREKEKPSFEQVLEKECVARRLDPRDLKDYTLKQALRI